MACNHKDRAYRFLNEIKKMLDYANASGSKEGVLIPSLTILASTQAYRSIGVFNRNDCDHWNAIANEFTRRK